MVDDGEMDLQIFLSDVRDESWFIFIGVGTVEGETAA